MRQANQNRIAILMMALALIIATTATRAAVVISYGDFTGTNTKYVGVTEADTTLPGPDTSPLYGQPAIAGDTLTFHPVNFSAAVSGATTELQDGRLTMNIQTVSPSGNLAALVLTEGGAWFVSNGTSLTLSEEALIVNAMFITAVNGQSVNPILVTPSISFTSTKSGSATVSSDADSIEFKSTGSIGNGSWNATANFNLAAALAGAGLTGKVTAASLDLDDQLIASGDLANSSAFIDKKFTNIGPTAIPEPTTANLLVIGAVSLLARRSKRNAA